MKTSHAPLTVLAALVALTLTGMSSSALAESSSIRTDVSMHNDDNNCILSVIPPDNGVSFSATMSIEDNVSHIAPVDGGERFIDVKLTGKGACILNSAKVTQSDSVPVLPGTNVRWRGVPTANGGVLPVFVFMTRVLGYTSPDMSAGSNVSVQAVSASGTIKGKYSFLDTTTQVLTEGSFYDTNGKNNNNYMSPYSTAGNRPNFLMLASTYYDYGGPLAYTQNRINYNYTQLENPTISATNSTDKLKLIRVGVGAMISDTPYAAADNLPDTDVVYDNEQLKFTSTITVTPL